MTKEELLVLIIVVCSVVVVGTISSILFYKFYYEKHRMANQIRAVDRKFQYHHGLLTGNCLQTISRLEVISHSNLVYADYHIKFFKRYRDILDRNDKIVEDDIYSLNDYLTDKKKKQFKEAYLRTVKQLDVYCNLVNNLNDELIAVLKPEEEAREAGFHVKEFTNEVRKKYVSISPSISLAIPSFEKIFTRIDNKFRTFEIKIDTAEYEEAKNILGPIDEVLNQLNNVIDKLPKICALFDTDLPTLISELRKKYDDVVAKEIPVYNVLNEETFTRFSKTCDEIREFIEKLNVDKANNEINSLIEEIKGMNEGIDKEIQAKDQFNNSYSSIYGNAEKIEKRVVKIYNDIDKIKVFYVFSSMYKSIVEDLKKLSDNLTTAKRKVDTFVHSSTKQPYTFIIRNLDEMNKATNELGTYIDGFDFYLKTLKENVEAAHKLVINSTLPLKERENIFKLLDLSSEIDSRVSFRFNRCFDLLNDINTATVTKPIDVDNVNKLVVEYKTVSDALVIDYNDIITNRDKCIVLFKKLNETRGGFENVNDDVKKAETLFNDCNFSGALDVLNNCSNRRVGIIESLNAGNK